MARNWTDSGNVGIKNDKLWQINLLVYSPCLNKQPLNHHFISMNWIIDLFKAIDRHDSEAFVSYLTEDSQFRFGNAEAVHGKANIKSAVDGFFSAIKSLEHKLENSWILDGHVFVNGNVTYTRHDDSTLSVPFANIFKMDNDKIQDYLIYADISALFTTQ